MSRPPRKNRKPETSRFRSSGPPRRPEDQRRKPDARDRGNSGDAAESAEDESFAGERLQKVLAAAGFGSRRQCEEWITQGRVEVDGEVVTELGTRVDTVTQQIRVDGVALPKHKREYYLLNKPVNVLCTNYDPSGRTRVVDLLPARERLFTVGRLDRASEGLILVTNDGELANRLTHPRYEVEKTYLVRIAGLPSPEVLSRLQKGVWLAEGLAKVASLTIRRQHRLSTDMEIVLKEGKNREIRRVLARVGHKVLWLKRIAMGPLRLGNLESGEFRRLLPSEVTALQEASEEAGHKRRGKRESGKSDAPSVAADASKPTKAPSRSPSTSRAESPKLISQPAVEPRAAIPARPIKTHYDAPPREQTDEPIADWEAELFDGTSAESDVSSSESHGQPPETPRRSGAFQGAVLGFEEPLSEASPRRAAPGLRDPTGKRDPAGKRDAAGKRKPVGKRGQAGKRRPVGKGGESGPRGEFSTRDGENRHARKRGTGRGAKRHKRRKG